MRAGRSSSAACPACLRVSLLIYVFDGLFVGLPLSIVAVYVGGLIQAIGWVAFAPERFEMLPPLVVAAAAVFCGDFISDFRHRLEHSAVLWPAHSLHHSDEEMTWFTIARFHPLNRVTTGIIDGAFLLMLGFPAWALVVNAFVRHYYGLFIHANLPWTLGPLGRVLASPAMHNSSPPRCCSR